MLNTNLPAVTRFGSCGELKVIPPDRTRCLCAVNHSFGLIGSDFFFFGLQCAYVYVNVSVCAESGGGLPNFPLGPHPVLPTPISTSMHINPTSVHTRGPSTHPKPHGQKEEKEQEIEEKGDTGTVRHRREESNPSLTLIVSDTFKCGFTGCRC